MRYFVFTAFFLLSACSAPEVPSVNKDTMDYGMMMHTESLAEGCAALTAKTAEEKAAIVHDIAHNMDKDALDLITGADCAFLGHLEKVTDLTEDDLKLNPNDDEVLYFSAETNQFFATCKSMNTLAYVVDRSNNDDAPKYFTENRDDFVAANSMMKEMIEMMGDMNGTDNDDDEEGMDIGGMYIEDSYEDIEVANAAIGNGKPVALFFFAAWCGFCQAKDGVLKKMYQEGDYNVSIYKVDFDTVTDLKAQYGVTTQDTVVLVDGDGNAVQTIIGATEDDLKEMLSL